MNALSKSAPGRVFTGDGRRREGRDAVTPKLNDSERVAAPSGVRRPTENPAKGVIAAIHTLKSRLKLSDDDYRALLLQLTGQSSSKVCTPAQQRQVRDHLQHLTERMGLANPVRRSSFEARVKAASPRERKVWALWLDMERRGLVRDKSSQALDSFIYRQTGVAALRWCTAPQLDAVIEALKSWQNRGVEVAR